MVYFPTFVGNEQLKEQLGTDIVSDTLSHAYILAGPYGSGKHTLAKLLAMAKCCSEKKKGSALLPCGICPSCRKFLSGQHPDITFINKGDKTTVSVASIRSLREDAVLSPTEGAYKFYVIEEADLMTAEAQNALLLTLESPPPYVSFFLLSEKPDRLLETVRSRAPTLRLSLQNESTIESYLVASNESARSLKKSNPGELKAVVREARGSIGRAVDLMDPAMRAPIESRRQITLDFIEALSGNHVLPCLNLLKKLTSSDRAELILQMSRFKDALRDLYLYKQSDRFPCLFFVTEEEMQAASAHLSEKKLNQADHATDEALEQIEANLNVRLLLHKWAIGCGML